MGRTYLEHMYHVTTVSFCAGNGPDMVSRWHKVPRQGCQTIAEPRKLRAVSALLQLASEGFAEGFLAALSDDFGRKADYDVKLCRMGGR